MKKDDDEQVLDTQRRFARQQTDFDDQQNEMAGHETGRQKRFLPETARSDGSNGKSADKRAEALTRLQLLLLNDPAYAALFKETAQQLNVAQSRLDIALEAVIEAQRLARERLEAAVDETTRREEEDRLDALEDLENDIRTGQAEIGDMQLRMDDEDDPAGEDNLNDFKYRADQIITDIEHKVSTELDRSDPPMEIDGATNQAAMEIAIPKI